jgi:hypothetical protein
MLPGRMLPGMVGRKAVTRDGNMLPGTGAGVLPKHYDTRHNRQVGGAIYTELLMT